MNKELFTNKEMNKLSNKELNKIKKKNKIRMKIAR